MEAQQSSNFFFIDFQKNNEIIYLKIYSSEIPRLDMGHLLFDNGWSLIGTGQRI